MGHPKLSVINYAYGLQVFGAATSCSCSVESRSLIWEHSIIVHCYLSLGQVGFALIFYFFDCSRSSRKRQKGKLLH